MKLSWHITTVILLAAFLCACGVHTAEDKSISTTEISDSKKTTEDPSSSEATEATETAVTEENKDINDGPSYSLSNRVSWFPLDVLLPNNWEGISEKAKAYGLRATNSSNNVGLPQKYISSPEKPKNSNAGNGKNSAVLMFVNETGPLARISITDWDFRWDLIEEYPDENPCISRLAVMYHDGVPEAAVAEIQLDDTDEAIAFMLGSRGEYGTEFVFDAMKAMHEYYPEQVPEIHSFTFEERCGQFQQGKTLNGTYEVKYLK